jgi:hypothetical protein
MPNKKFILATFISALFVLTLFISRTNLPFASVKFSDLSSSSPFFDSVNYVQSQGIVSGYSDGTYKPDSNVNRAEFTKIIIGTIFAEEEISGCVPNKTFSDVHSDDWFHKYICAASNNGIIDGYSNGSFKPANYTNFAEASKIIVNAFGYETSEKEVWYQPFVEKLEEFNAIPETIYSFERNITRGEMAEMIYRLEEGIQEKASSKFFSGEAELGENTTFVKTYRFYDQNGGIGVWPTEEGDYILAGWTVPRLDDDSIIAKLDSQGDILWAKMVGSEVHYSGPMGQGPASDNGYFTTQLKDGSYLLWGQTNGYVGDAEADIYETPIDISLSKFNKNGEHSWTKTIGDLAGDTPVYCWPTNDGGFLLLLTLEELNAGAAEVGDTNHYFALAKFNADGENKWTKKTNLNVGKTMGDGEQVYFTFDYTEKSNIAIVGTMPSDDVSKDENEEVISSMPVIAKLDENEDLLWARSIETVPMEYYTGISDNYVKYRTSAGDFSAVQETSDGGYLAIGFLSPFAIRESGNDYPYSYETLIDLSFLAVKFDENGEFKWAKTIEPGLYSFDNKFKVVETPDNDFIIMFNYMSGGEQLLGDPYENYMSAAEELTTLCNEKDCTLNDLQTDPELKALNDKMNEAQDQWFSTSVGHIALIKIDDESNVKWIRNIGPEVKPYDIRKSTGAPYQFVGKDIKIDNDGEILVAGNHGSDVVCSVQFGISFYCNDALLIKLDINGNLFDNSGLVTNHYDVSQRDLSQYIITREVEPEISDYSISIKSQQPSIVGKSTKATTTLASFMTETVTSVLQEAISSVATPETTPQAKTQAYMYYENAEIITPESGASSEVHSELLPILDEIYDNEVKLWDNFGGISLDYCFGRLVTENDIRQLQEELEKLGYSLAMEIEDGKLIMSKVGRTLNLQFSIISKNKGTLSVTW